MLGQWREPGAKCALSELGGTGPHALPGREEETLGRAFREVCFKAALCGLAADPPLQEPEGGSLTDGELIKVHGLARGSVHTQQQKVVPSSRVRVLHAPQRKPRAAGQGLHARQCRAMPPGLAR